MLQLVKTFYEVIFVSNLFKKCLCVILSAIILSATCVTFAPGVLAAEETVQKESYISGYPDGTFKPDANVTRAEALAILFRVIDDVNKNLPFNSSFDDVFENDWYYKYVAYFDRYQYLEDYGSSFEPNKAITRKEFVYLLTEINTPYEFYQKEFTDVDKEHPYYMSICKAAAAGYVGGYPDGSFRPDGNITRAEMVTVMNRYLQRQATGNAGTVTFSDVSKHWAKDQIIVSANERKYTNSKGETVTVWEEKEPEYVFEIPEGNTYVDNINYLLDNSTSMNVNEYINAVDTVIDAKIQEIINSETTIEITGQKYYVSNNGDDKNDGKTPETAWRTLSKVNSSFIEKGGAVLFERGGLWRGRIVTKGDVIYSAYGEGEKPRIYGSAKNYGTKANWVSTENENVFKLKDKIVNVGVVAYGHTGEIGNVTDLVGQAVKKIEYLTEDLQFCSDRTTNELFVYSANGQNPGERFENIEIGGFGNIITPYGVNDTIDNLTIMYGGSHGIGRGSSRNLTVTNCVIAWVGGSYIAEGSDTRYGNAIEVWGAGSGYTTINNYCYQIYDTGITIQCGSPGNYIQEDVIMQENVVEYCAWGLEFYNTGYTEEDERLCKNFDISYNSVRYCGYGWGRVGTGASYASSGMTPNTENFRVERNIFHTALVSHLVLQPGGDEKIEFISNLYIHQLGKTLGYYKGKRYNCTDNSFEQLETVFGQENPILIYDYIIPPTKL